jgi:hypothetical protein
VVSHRGRNHLPSLYHLNQYAQAGGADVRGNLRRQPAGPCRDRYGQRRGRDLPRSVDERFSLAEEAASQGSLLRQTREAPTV